MDTSPAGSGAITREGHALRALSIIAKNSTAAICTAMRLHENLAKLTAKLYTLRTEGRFASVFAPQQPWKPSDAAPYEPPRYPVTGPEERQMLRLVYISGPMTGHANFNAPAFARVENWLRNMGNEVFNPARNAANDNTRPRKDYMRRDIEALLRVDAIALLPGWQESAGAMLEFCIACELGLEIIDIGNPSGQPSDMGGPDAKCKFCARKRSEI